MAAARVGAVFGNFAKSRLATLRHYKSELLPLSPAEIPQAIAGATRLVGSAATFKFMNLTTKEALVNTIVAVEVICWFFVGECIGKRALVGYKV
uniref:ATP synthase subunit g, mitochondrial n=1 Tax=Caligus rogercresseyi TaxID=217165 RepID=C1BN08_CALRO|nr:ATP synthase subunit g, mitochondrial [Caligus rogercresseyi]